MTGGLVRPMFILYGVGRRNQTIPNILPSIYLFCLSGLNRYYYFTLFKLTEKHTHSTIRKGRFFQSQLCLRFCISLRRDRILRSTSVKRSNIFVQHREKLGGLTGKPFMTKQLLCF